MRAIEVSQFGGPEVLQLVEVPDVVATPGLLRIDVTAAGVNFADTHRTEDSYLAKQSLPFIPGGEVVGRTEDGRRVLGFTATANGGYAEQALIAESLALPVPDSVSDGAALSLLVQGLTAWHLLRTLGHMASGETVVVNAAAGGVGSLAVQLSKLWGAGRVIGLASSQAKRDLVLSLGADVALDSNETELAAAVRAANDDKGVDLVLEMAGGKAGDELLAATGTFGRFVIFGMASREPMQLVAPGALMRGSRTVSGFWLVDCMSPERFADMVVEPLRAMLDLVATGALRPIASDAFPLANAADAHRALLARTTTGKVILTTS